MLKHDLKTIKEQVMQIPSKWGWLILAASTSQRFLNVISEYEKQAHLGYWNRTQQMNREIWNAILAKSFDEKYFQDHIAWIYPIIPGDQDEFWIDITPLFDDSICTMIYTFYTFVSDDSSNPSWVSECAFNCCYYYVELREDAKDYSVDFTSDPVVQQELLRQQRDLQELTEFDYENCDEEAWHKLVEHFRVRSENEPALPDLSE